VETRLVTIDSANASAAFARCLMADFLGNADFSGLEQAALRLSEELVRRQSLNAPNVAVNAFAHAASALF